MSEADKDPTERMAISIAIELYGRPKRCSGWNAKVFNAACEGAHRGLELAEQQRLSSIAANFDDLAIARRCAVSVLMARLPRADFAARKKLKARIALIRCGRGDHTPEVQAALLALVEKQ